MLQDDCSAIEADSLIDPRTSPSSARLSASGPVTTEGDSPFPRLLDSSSTNQRERLCNRGMPFVLWKQTSHSTSSI